MANQQQRDLSNAVRDGRGDLVGQLDQVARQSSNIAEQPKDNAAK